jgi:RNA polymerase sigma factor (sigma-70 family)
MFVIRPNRRSRSKSSLFARTLSLQASFPGTSNSLFNEYYFSLQGISLGVEADSVGPDLDNEYRIGFHHDKTETPEVENTPDDYFDDFVEDLNDPKCVQRIYDFAISQVRGMVDYNDEDDVIQEVFYRLTKWPIGKKYNSARHYFSLLKITIRQAIAAYWKRRHSQRNDVRKRVFISQLQQDGNQNVEFAGQTENALQRLHLKDLIWRVMEKASTLTQQQRTMFQLRFLDGKSHEEVAVALGISIRTSYRLEIKVREILQAYFSDQIVL